VQRLESGQVVAPYNPAQIIYGDYLYTLFDRGFLARHGAKTGQELCGKQRITPTAFEIVLRRTLRSDLEP